MIAETALSFGFAIPIIKIADHIGRWRLGVETAELYIARYLDLGDDQKNLLFGSLSKDLVPTLHISQGAHINVSSEDFRPWLNEGGWCDFLRYSLENGATVSAYARGIHQKARPLIDELCSSGLEVRLSDRIPNEESITVDSPRQIWNARSHRSRKSYICSFTPKPSDQAWEMNKRFYDMSRFSSEPYQPKKS